MKCIFCDIVQKTSPSHIVYENDEVIAILDIYPASKGHTLVMPKKHYINIKDMPKELLDKIMSTIQKLVKEYSNKGLTDFNIMHSAGKFSQQEIPHFHLIPRKKNDKINFKYTVDEKARLNLYKTFKKLKSSSDLFLWVG